jgi:hypothetical protein
MHLLRRCLCRGLQARSAQVMGAHHQRCEVGQPREHRTLLHLLQRKQRREGTTRVVGRQVLSGTQNSRRYGRANRSGCVARSHRCPAQCCLTPHSSRAPTASHQARSVARYILHSPGLAPSRRCRLSSNVRPHKDRSSRLESKYIAHAHCHSAGGVRQVRPKHERRRASIRRGG